MKRNLLYIISLIIVLSSCSENERLTYNDKSAVYFNADSIVFSFTMVKDDSAVMDIPVRLLGLQSENERKIFVRVTENSSAVEGKDYKSLNDYYILPANNYEMSIPLTLMCNTDLDTQHKVLELELLASDDFDIAFPSKAVYKISFTNQLIEPSYWDDKLYNYFGEYSKVKHQVCVDIMGHDFPLKFDNNYQYYMRIGRAAALYFTINKVEDENGELIQPWDPF